MKQVKIVQVTIEIGDGGRWDGTFVGKPTKAEVISALEAERLARRQKHVDASHAGRTNLVDTRYQNFTSMIQDYGIPKPVNRGRLVCDHNNEQIGTIQLSPGHEVYITAIGAAAAI